MELLQLRYFLTTAEYQHMTKAAEHLQIAQPALSQAIHRLESELGIPLFERKNRSIELNDAGRLLQKRLIPIISALDRIPGELMAGQYQSSHTIHLKLLAASTLITNRIIAYRTLRPDVNFQLYQSDTNADFDLCVSAIRSDLKNDEYSDYMVMLEEDLYLAVPTHSPYGDKDSIRLADTKNAGYICLAGSRPIRQICNSYFSEADFRVYLQLAGPRNRCATSLPPDWESASGHSIPGVPCPLNGVRCPLIPRSSSFPSRTRPAGARSSLCAPPMARKIPLSWISATF